MANNEVEFCGHCKRQQREEEGYKCKICGRPTVTWNTSTESAEKAMEKWKWRNPNG